MKIYAGHEGKQAVHPSGCEGETTLGRHWFCGLEHHRIEYIYVYIYIYMYVYIYIYIL